ncbi:UPF0488 protein C8orf33 homolog isoform X2 [Malaclemys terrapin pileata]|uniref:UPF0488 protein C8orf33 homolog isoform X2 n=1 Tax=Malaclemys terrapin pileata TaxID=2991368 RepID=UPI0023A83B3C|nr:UPF0488 protein C8orf33 homolog isoform X2 [Malaclemys terrapin pileata]
MEETPQGTFQDELEWCILQLETGLLRLNPTPKQAEETQHILKVLRSRKAAFVKKRQVMNRVFGDYRLKIAEEQKKMEKAETPKPEIAAEDEVKAEKTAATGAPKKNKKKKLSNSKKEMAEAEVSKKVKVGASGCEDTDLSLQDKTTQQSDKQLWREVDWCVEQLELGLKTQKSTPKQAEEVLRAIKTLRSDKAVLAKKRQVMRAMFGDYKKMMEEERQKQLKLMQAAAKSAQVMEVRENARRKSSQVFRKCSEASRKSPSSAGSPSHPPSHPESRQASGTNSFMSPTSQEAFRFNFF